MLRKINKIIKTDVTGTNVTGCEGSIVVEAAIVVPIIILSLIAIIYVSFLTFQKAYLQLLADRTAEKGAHFWKNRYSNVETGRDYKICPEGMELYWWLWDTSNEEKRNKLESYLESRAGKYSIIKAVDRKASVSLLNYVIGKKVRVVIEESYIIPGADLLKMFGIKNVYKIKAVSESMISDPDELIRNVDLLIDIERELEEKYPELRDTRDKIQSTLESIHDSVKKLLE
ncbi:MAG TPA: hypothetical protein GXX36_06000 [Clostridiaceae bacterium]|nr:hypothetical protein [Clostridiaceae bacterium]